MLRQSWSWGASFSVTYFRCLVFTRLLMRLSSLQFISVWRNTVERRGCFTGRNNNSSPGRMATTTIARNEAHTLLTNHHPILSEHLKSYFLFICSKFEKISFIHHPICRMEEKGGIGNPEIDVFIVWYMQIWNNIDQKFFFLNLL